jgi:N-acetylmuramoyl-L-alanine amidase
MEVRLGYAPQVVTGELCVHAVELRKTLQPLLTSAPALCPGTPPVLVIDPGHGGENAGTTSVLAGQYEKTFTLDWARRLERILTTNGWQVFLTRTNDTDLALSNRIAFAEAHKAAFFVSLHFNSAAPDHTQSGLETYCLTPAGLPSSVTRGFPDDASLTFANNNFDLQNLQLALRVHRELLRVQGVQDRGIRRARFLGVLRNQQRPAVLIEGGYLSNTHEAGLIASGAYRQKLAEAVARAFVLAPAAAPATAAAGGAVQAAAP